MVTDHQLLHQLAAWSIVLIYNQAAIERIWYQVRPRTLYRADVLSLSTLVSPLRESGNPIEDFLSLQNFLLLCSEV